MTHSNLMALVAELRSWPSPTQGDALSASVVADMMERAAQAIATLTAEVDRLNVLIEQRPASGCQHDFKRVETIKYGGPGQYLVLFQMDGSTYGEHIYADNAEDAQRRLAAIRLTGKVEGGPCRIIKMPGPLAYLALPFMVAWTALLNLIASFRKDRS